MDQIVNLLVDLDERFDAVALADAMRGIESAGYSARRVDDARGSDVLEAWIDDVFGGTWSTEAAAGASVVAENASGIAGFASFAPHGLRFSWLRGIGAETGVGVFGPFGVAPEHRKSGIGPHLLTAALASLRERGYARALIPAVGEEKLVEYYTRHAGARVAEQFEKRSFIAHKYRTVVLASGNGSNFAAVLDAAHAGRLPLDVAGMVCNRPGAFVLERARDAGVAAQIVAWDRQAESRAAYDARLLHAVTGEEPELVLLLGWMHLFDGTFVRAFGGRAINVHPAYLPLDGEADTVIFPDGEVSPAFRGAHAMSDALTAGAAWIGATAHELDERADRGRVLVRKPLRLPPGADADSALALLRPVEQRVVAGGIMRWVYER